MHSSVLSLDDRFPVHMNRLWMKNYHGTDEHWHWHDFYAVVEQINQIMIRRRKIERFIESVKGLPELITEFDESLWAALVDNMTVYAKDRIVFRLTCGVEIDV